MTNSSPGTNRDPEATVYDVNGNAVGTIAEIYFDDISQLAFAASQAKVV